MNRRSCGFSVACLALLLGAVSARAESYGIGNATPPVAYFVQGQSFTPSDFGNESSPVLPASSPGTVYLTSFTIDYDFSSATPYDFLYIYDSAPNETDAATGVGSLATGTLISGGDYAFGGIPLAYNTKYYAVLPGSENIFDDSGNPYTGGVDLFPQAGTVAEGFGDFDIGFNATFDYVPEPNTAVLLAIGGLLTARRRRRN